MIVPNGGVVVDFDVAAQIDTITNDFCAAADKSRELKAAWRDNAVDAGALVELERLEHEKYQILLRLAAVCIDEIGKPYYNYRKQLSEEKTKSLSRTILQLVGSARQT